MPAQPIHSPAFIRPAVPADFAAWMEMAADVRDDFPGMTSADHRDAGVFVHVYPGVSAARFLYLSLGFRDDEFIRQEDQVYQILVLSPERLKGIVRQRRNFSAAGGCL